MVEKIIKFTEGKVGELVLNTVISKITECKEKKEWEQLFVNSNEFLLKKVDNGNELLCEVADLLSSDDIKNIAMNLTQESKYKLSDKLHTELKKLMMRYEIPSDEASYYINGFMMIIFNEIEKVNPDAFQCAFLGEWREREEAALALVRKEIGEVKAAIATLNANEVQVYSPEQIEIDLYKRTTNPSIGLDFFEIDDEAFREEFEDALSNDNVYICGQCKEETIFCVINELKRISADRVVLLVRSEDDWKKLYKANEDKPELGGEILIPWFYAEQIYSIPNNTNIFVFGKDEYLAGKKGIELRKRKRSTVRNKLIEAGLDSSSAYRLVDDTHGLYAPLMKKIVNGIENGAPNWVKGDKKLIIPLLLCGKWSESEGDKLVVEDLCGKPYSEVLEQIHEYIFGEEPLFVRFKNHEQYFVHLASTENAWDYLDEYVDVESDLWKKYIGLIIATVTEENPVYNFPKEQQSFATLLPGGTPCWSETLKEGLLRSLVMKAYYKNNPRNQRIVDQVVEDILAKIQNKKQWLSISRLFPSLCEASPKAVVSRLDSEWSTETGLCDVFADSKDEGLFARNEYTHFIWGIEQFLCQKEYATWAIRWFLKMNEVRRKFPITNSPFDTLERIFCPWLNLTVLKQEEKVQIAKNAFSDGYDVWDLFYSELPGQKTSIMSSSSKPQYRIVDDPIQVVNKDVWLAYREYTDLCIHHINFDVERWTKMLDNVNHFNTEILTTMFDELLYEINSMNDLEKITIKEKVREEIYRNRFYKDSEWAMKEDNLALLEDILNSIHTENHVYEYRYLFKNDFNFPLLHPYSYSEDEKHEINRKLADEEISTGISRFRAEGLNPVELAEVCAEYDYNSLGAVLFQNYSDNEFDDDLVLGLLYDEKLMATALGYIGAAYRQSSRNLVKAFELAEKVGASDYMKARILCIEDLDAANDPLIMRQSDGVKKQYWKLFKYGWRNLDGKTARLVIGEMLKYSDHMSMIEALDNCKEFFSDGELLSIMESLKERETGTVTSMSEYYLTRILSRLQKAFLDKDECAKVALLEVSYRGVINVSDMKCFNKALRESPVLYLIMLAAIYKTDDGERVESIPYDKENISSLFSLYYELKFCPAEQGGKVNRDKLETWILEFKKGLEANRQLHLFEDSLGKLFAASPIGSDGFYPVGEIREVIEKLNSKDLQSGYVRAVCNFRGVYTSTGGVEERRIAQKYKDNANAIRTKYPITARIYDSLYDHYIYEADSERESDEYAGV